VIDRSTANCSNPKEALGRTFARFVDGVFNSALIQRMERQHVCGLHQHDRSNLDGILKSLCSMGSSAPLIRRIWASGTLNQEEGAAECYTLGPVHHPRSLNSTFTISKDVTSSKVVR
jgi:hypothetical protein